MKIILRKDVANVGQKGDIKEVKDGFFRNFLMPQKLADLATFATVKEWEKDRAAREQERANMKGKVAGELAMLSSKNLVFFKKANEQGHLYDRVDKKEILSSLHEAGAKAIKMGWIALEEPLGAIGEFEVEIKTPFGENGIVKIVIAPERVE